jgi:hypothetical protein
MSATQEQLSPVTFDEQAQVLRRKLKLLGDEVKELHKSAAFVLPEEFEGQDSEMKANIMLSFRHIEDAAMRLGKAIQAYDGGVSVYDKQS